MVDVVDKPMTLQEAAGALGVHYMTAYRYVRLGLLSARKSAGAWQVAEADLETFRNRAVVVEATRPSAPWAQRFENRLLAGDANGAWGVVEAALTGGAELDEVYLDVIAPAMESIGARWSLGELDVAMEHRASAIVARLLGRIGHRFARRGRPKGVVVLGAPAGEVHSLPVSMAADLVRQGGWDVSDLGVDLPVGSFVHGALETDDVVAVGLSVTMADSLVTAIGTLSALREAVHPGVVLIVGGRAIRCDEHAAELGADGYAPDGRSLALLLDSLVRRGPEYRAV